MKNIKEFKILSMAFRNHRRWKMRVRNKMVKLSIFILATLLTAGFITGLSQASEVLRLSKGQTVYVPLYSNVIFGDRELAWELSALLSIRNTDSTLPITISRVEYYDTDGKLVKKYLEKSKQVTPMGSVYFYVKTSDTAGGWGANFLVEWKSEEKVNEPIIESLMVGLRGTHSVSFISPGRVIER